MLFINIINGNRLLPNIISGYQVNIDLIANYDLNIKEYELFSYTNPNLSDSNTILLPNIFYNELHNKSIKFILLFNRDKRYVFYIASSQNNNENELQVPYWFLIHNNFNNEQKGQIRILSELTLIKKIIYSADKQEFNELLSKTSQIIEKIKNFKCLTSGQIIEICHDNQCYYLTINHIYDKDNNELKHGSLLAEINTKLDVEIKANN